MLNFTRTVALLFCMGLWVNYFVALWSNNFSENALFGIIVVNFVLSVSVFGWLASTFEI